MNKIQNKKAIPEPLEGANVTALIVIGGIFLAGFVFLYFAFF